MWFPPAGTIRHQGSSPNALPVQMLLPYAVGRVEESLGNSQGIVVTHTDHTGTITVQMWGTTFTVKVELVDYVGEPHCHPTQFGGRMCHEHNGFGYHCHDLNPPPDWGVGPGEMYSDNTLAATEDG